LIGTARKNKGGHDITFSNAIPDPQKSPLRRSVSLKLVKAPERTRKPRRNPWNLKGSGGMVLTASQSAQMVYRYLSTYPKDLPLNYTFVSCDFATQDMLSCIISGATLRMHPAVRQDRKTNRQNYLR
jgi:hypothetical protein